MLQKSAFNEINKKNTRPIVLFGSGNIAKKTIRKVGRDKVAFIADNSKDLQGQEYHGFPIKSPENISSEHFVIITSTAITAISEQLQSMGLSANTDFTISPVLNDRIAISELEGLHTEFYFASGAISAANKYGKHGNSRYGGGLFKCILEGISYRIEQVYEGPVYSSIRIGDRILFIDCDKGLMELDGGKVRLLAELPAGARSHGLSYNKSNGNYYVACSDRDSVLELDSSYTITREFKLSNKMEHSGEPMHHCNDCLAIGNSLYVSMFSSSGNWKNDSFDGCVTEFDLTTGERLRDVKTDLWMPHNIDFFDGSLHVLNSLPGTLLFNNFTVQGRFPGFSRGLDYKNGLYYIGQSKNRNHSKVIGISNAISIDCAIILFDPVLKIFRTLHLPEVSGIHSITC